MHVHTSVDDPDKAIAVTTRSSPPHRAPRASPPARLLARGADVLQSSAQMVFSHAPLGVPPRFADYAEYAKMIGKLERTGTIADYPHLAGHPRPRAARHDRAEDCDAVTTSTTPSRSPRTSRPSSSTTASSSSQGSTLAGHTASSRRDKFLAARHGLDAPVMDLASGASDRARSPSSCGGAREVEPDARELGADRELEVIADILRAATARTASSASGTRTGTSPRSSATCRRCPRSTPAAFPRRPACRYACWGRPPSSSPGRGRPR